jgi:hypothetical protein
LNIQDDIDLVESFLVEELSAHVVFGPDEPNAYWEHRNTMCVSICTKQSKRLQLYSILHEAGHAIIRSDRRYEVLYPYGRVSKTNKSISKRVDVVREEVAAWNEGEILSHKLGITLDMPKWHKFLKKNLFEYTKWAQDPKKYNLIGKKSS